ncbi:phage baseplate assembly protein domain-containing protein [Acinetobacter guillouiae]|uniref:phage baseplate assembly protein domain-containing protein n=1 Tax=Acinetobacter guillouiae TaxID=106649 RepID=UPI0032B34DFC
MMEKLYHGLMNLVGLGWGFVVNDDSDTQKIQVKFNQAETKDEIPRYADYGFQSSPPDGHNALVLFFGGNKSSGVVIATHHAKSRKKGLKKGEVCISDDQGQHVYITRDGITLVDKAGTTVELTGDGKGQITSSGVFTINGVEFKDGIAKGLDFQAGKISQIKHRHKDSRNGDTTPPIP